MICQISSIANIISGQKQIGVIEFNHISHKRIRSLAAENNTHGFS